MERVRSLNVFSESQSRMRSIAKGEREKIFFFVHKKVEDYQVMEVWSLPIRSKKRSGSEMQRSVVYEGSE